MVTKISAGDKDITIQNVTNKNVTQKIMPKKEPKYKKLTVRKILKASPKTTYVIESNSYRNSSFNKEWNKENMLKWS